MSFNPCKSRPSEGNDQVIKDNFCYLDPKVREGNSGKQDNSDMAFHGPHRNSSDLYICIPYLRTLQYCTVVKTAARE